MSQTYFTVEKLLKFWQVLLKICMPHRGKPEKYTIHCIIIQSSDSTDYTFNHGSTQDNNFDCMSTRDKVNNCTNRELHLRTL